MAKSTGAFSAGIGTRSQSSQAVAPPPHVRFSVGTTMAEFVVVVVVATLVALYFDGLWRKPRSR